MVLFTSYSKFPVWSPHYQTLRKKTCALTGSTVGVYGRLRSGMRTKQEYVDRLNSFKNTVLITVMFVSVLQPNTTFYLSKWWGSIRGVLVYRRKSRVYKQYARQDCPMKNTEIILQYYYPYVNESFYCHRIILRTWYLTEHLSPVCTSFLLLELFLNIRISWVNLSRRRCFVCKYNNVNKEYSKDLILRLWDTIWWNVKL